MMMSVLQSQIKTVAEKVEKWCKVDRERAMLIAETAVLLANQESRREYAMLFDERVVDEFDYTKLSDNDLPDGAFQLKYNGPK